MPLDLLEELEVPASSLRKLGDIEEHVRIAMAELSAAVEGMKNAALPFQNAWQQIVLAVADGHTQEIQKALPRLKTAFENRLRLLREAYETAANFKKLGRADVPNPDDLLPEIAGMERLQTTVFDRWRTDEDLEDLAARDYPLTTADLDRIRPFCKPPASWYEGEVEKPF